MNSNDTVDRNAETIAGAEPDSNEADHVCFEVKDSPGGERSGGEAKCADADLSGLRTAALYDADADARSPGNEKREQMNKPEHCEKGKPMKVKKKKKIGRPSFRPSDEDRRNVQGMSACGLPEEQIARLTGRNKGISPKTLRKHFRHELSVGIASANATVGQTFYQMAASGKCVAATIFYMKTRMPCREKSILPITEPKRVIEVPDYSAAREKLQALLSRHAGSSAAEGVPVDVQQEVPETGLPVEGLPRKS